MIHDLIRYSAPAAKTRGMFGKLLTDAQWEKLLSAGELYEVRDVLEDCPGWSDAAQAGNAEDMTHALDGILSADCRRLGFYMSAADREQLSVFLRQRSRTITPEEYQKWLRKGGKGGMSARAIMGAEADALNLVYILRLRRFPKSAEQAEKYLLPVRNKLTPRLRDRLLRARDDGQVLDILANTPWGGLFTSLEPGELEKQYQRAMVAYCRRVMTGAQPGLGVIQAFLVLKDMERRRLVRLIGAVTRGIDPRTAM